MRVTVSIHRKLPTMTKLALTLVLFSTLLVSSHAASQNITTILDGFPNYSFFNTLISQYGVAAQINSRTTITVLCPPNSILQPVVNSLGNNPDRQTVYNILSYHVLFDYYDIPKLQAIVNRTVLVTTLFQSSGLAPGNGGFVNITIINKVPHVGTSEPGDTLKTIIGQSLAAYPFNISVLSIDGVLVPAVVGAPAPSPAPANITQTLIQSGNYSTLLSLLKATGVDLIFQSHDTPPGITIFAPTDAAFAALPKGALDALTNAQKVAILEFHALSFFYSLQELGTLSGPQSTLASGSGGGSYTFTVSKSKSGATLINTGRNVATVGATLYSTTPVSIFSLDSVLLPTDIFGVAPVSAPTPVPAAGPTPGSSPSPVPTSAPSPSLTPASTPSMSPSSPPAPPSGTPSTGPSAASAPQSPSSFAAPKFVNQLWILASAFAAAASLTL